MKDFFQFLREASDSIAVMQAKRMGLKTDGHGGWYDNKGEFIAKTENGELTFFNKRQKVGKKDPDQSDKEKKLSYSSTYNSKSEQNSPKSSESSIQSQPETQPETQNVLSSTEEPPQVEKTKGILTIAFGRFNPPTIGHEKLLSTVAKSSDNGDYIIVPSRSFDNDKNPLDPDTKISIMRKMFPDHGEKIVNDPVNRTIFDVLKKAHMDGYSGIRIVGGSDRISEFEKLANNYNGKLYSFDNLEVVSSGERDPDSDDEIKSMSASKLRKAAFEGDFNTFKKGVPSTLNTKQTRELYNTIRSNMGVVEEENLWKIAPRFDWKNLRENYIQENIFRIGELVESLNTGLIGRIIRRGTNYLICVTEDNIMFKSWIKDVSESKRKLEIPSKNLKKLSKDAVERSDSNVDGFVDNEDKKTGPYGAFIPQARNMGKLFRKLQKEQKNTNVSGVPADKRLVGTNSYVKYTEKMTPGSEWGKQFINKYRKK